MTCGLRDLVGERNDLEMGVVGHRIIKIAESASAVWPKADMEFCCT
jgi:hypothetical protein